MCTAISTHGKYHLFGRTLDLEYSYGESAVILPRKFPIDFTHEGRISSHEAIIGIAHVKDGKPLYYDAINESGLGIAALNFPVSAHYRNSTDGMHNIASFEMILWVLAQCKTADEAKKLLERTNITSDATSPELVTTPLHWMIADADRAICAEPMESGLLIHENPFGVMTNEPPFESQCSRITEYLHLSPKAPKNSIFPEIELAPHSRGTGALGLPGDYSSASRFVRAVFASAHTAKADSENMAVSRFFHIADTVSIPDGVVATDENKNVRTVYTSCAFPKRREYCFTTYENRRISSLTLTEELANSENITAISLDAKEDVLALYMR